MRWQHDGSGRCWCDGSGGGGGQQIKRMHRYANYFCSIRVFIRFSSSSSSRSASFNLARYKQCALKQNNGFHGVKCVSTSENKIVHKNHKFSNEHTKTVIHSNLITDQIYYTSPLSPSLTRSHEFHSTQM